MGINAPIYLFSDETLSKEVVHLPLFEICYKTVSVDINAYDAIVFTSKNSVKALDRLGISWQTKDAYAIGEGTGRAIKEHGGRLLFTCKHSYGDLFAQELIPLLQNKRVFFPRAKEVISPLYEILRHAGISMDQLVVYETVCKTYDAVFRPPSNAILIFTSPSTVHCFLKNFAWDEHYRAVVIGTKTAAVLPLHVKPLIADIQTIEHCITLAKAL